MGKNKMNHARTKQPYPQPWANPKHAHSQVNGETQLSQDLIILQNETRKRS
ncbi:YpzG family protein [Metabacillus arenae]|uniref:YpzG family protein n=1 Tax=Metabacillus arenae TaxID=2771434 RepID=A0A926S040_9BACI|nr:YpzG family protein [Metabacillus arenae]MBD1379654.1 YpzG family protein [Metabacillus arenae]